MKLRQLYANNAALLAESCGNLKRMLSCFDVFNISSDGDKLDLFNKFRYLEAKSSKDGCDKDELITVLQGRRIGRVRKAFMNGENLKEACNIDYLSQPRYTDVEPLSART